MNIHDDMSNQNIDREKLEKQQIYSMLHRIEQEAKEYADELKVSVSTGYDFLAVIHGQALLEDMEVSPVEPPPPYPEPIASVSQSNPLEVMGNAMDGDDLLIRKIRSGQDEAFRILFDRYVDQVYQYVYHRIKRVADAEDIVESTFQRVFTYLQKYSDKDLPNVKSWLFTIAKGLLNDYYRRSSKKRLRVAEFIEHYEPSEQLEIEQDDEQLINAMLLGEHEAFACLYKRYYSDVSSHIVYFMGHGALGQASTFALQSLVSDLQTSDLDFIVQNAFENIFLEIKKHSERGERVAFHSVVFTACKSVTNAWLAPEPRELQGEEQEGIIYSLLRKPWLSISPFVYQPFQLFFLQRAMAKTLGVDIDTLIDWEHGKYIPHPDSRRQLSHVSKSSIERANDFSVALRKARLKRMWTMEELAKKLHVHVRTISLWERGKTMPSQESWQRLCQIIGSTPEKEG